MPTLMRPELSVKNEYWISKHRYYELKHFCRQYPSWKKEYGNYVRTSTSAPSLDRARTDDHVSDPTANQAIVRSFYSMRIELIESTAKKTDEFLYMYIVKAVTEGLSYAHLKTKLDIPCSRDAYYVLYRRFFWLLCKFRN